MKILISGDRKWFDYAKMKKRMLKIPADSVIIQGGARGADTMAGIIARELGMEVIQVNAEWEKYHRAAGVIRNRAMLDMKPEMVIAFHSNIENSKGTKDCVTEARKRGITVEIVS